MQGSRQKRVLRAGTKLKKMKNSVIVLLAALAGFVSCSKEGFIGCDRAGDYSGMYDMPMGGGNYPGRPGGQAGVLTAGEWNDLDHWDFWSGLMTSDAYKSMPRYWGLYTPRRVAVRVADAAGKRLPAVRIVLEQNQV